jgi:peptidoglycan/xylan/chitin deacetylase (PgdA/CDA1 family)
MLMWKFKDNKFWLFVGRLAVFVAAIGVIAAAYKFGETTIIAMGAPSPQQVQNQASIDDFIKGNPFTPNTYHPQTPPAALPGANETPIIGRVATTEPVIFLTIDDGVYTDNEAFFLMHKRGVTASLFLNDDAVTKHVDFFKYWQQFGSTIQNHTVNHPHLIGMPHAQQKQEICDNADLLQAKYGTRSTLFRAPYGESDDSTKKAAAECGMKATVWWSVVVDNGKLAYQDNVTKLRPGDILLLHFTEHLHTDLEAVFKQADAQELEIGRLEDWVY